MEHYAWLSVPMLAIAAWQHAMPACLALQTSCCAYLHALQPVDKSSLQPQIRFTIGS